MIRSEISFLNMDQTVLFRRDKFLEKVGFLDIERNTFLTKLRKFQDSTASEPRNFKCQTRFLLDETKKQYTTSLHYNSSNFPYVSIQTETFFLNYHLKNRIFKRWNSRLSDGWFFEISNYKTFHRVYSGNLQFLKKYLYQDSSIERIDLPSCVAFKTASDWQNFKWAIPEIDLIDNKLK